MEINDKAVNIFAMIKNDLQQIGDVGCARLTNDFPLQQHEHSVFNYDNQFQGDENAFTIRYAAYPGLSLFSDTAEKRLATTTIIKVKVNDWFILADCKHAELVSISHISKEKTMQYITMREQLNYFYKKNAELNRLVVHRFFFKKNEDNKFSLFIQDEKKQINRLLDDIKFFSLRYFVKNSDRLISLSAKDISDWTKVVGIKLKLVLAVYPLEKTWYHFFAIRTND